MPDRLLNEQSRPRIIVDVTNHSTLEKLTVLDQWPGTVRAASMKEVNWDEWDALITDREVVSTGSPVRKRSRLVPDEVPVFMILPKYEVAGPLMDYAGEGGSGYVRWAWSQGSHLRQPEGLPREVAELIASSLFPDLSDRDVGLDTGHWGIEVVEPDVQSPLILRPFLAAPNEVMVAGTYTRGRDGVTNWVIPADTDFVAWLRLAFARWGDELPERFPAGPAWQHSSRWATAEEATPLQAIRAADAVLERAQREHRDVVAAAQNELEAARSAADLGLRRLLTDDGEGLVAAAAQAFTVLGFVVRNMDDVHPAGQRHEDLQVSDENGWLGIVEVTGTRRGVLQSKWHRLITHLTNYLRGAGSNRSAVPWLVVNQERQQDPETRSRLWQESFEAEVSDARGLGIEAPALFVLATRIEDGSLMPEDARKALQGQVGVFTVADARAA